MMLLNFGVLNKKFYLPPSNLSIYNYLSTNITKINNVY